MRGTGKHFACMPPLGFCRESIGFRLSSPVELSLYATALCFLSAILEPISKPRRSAMVEVAVALKVPQLGTGSSVPGLAYWCHGSPTLLATQDGTPATSAVTF